MPEYDSYDLIVAGGGTAGCLIASRIAQHGINPRTGDRLRVALIEGGPYFIRGESELRPGYGVPERRKAVGTSLHGGVADSVGKAQPQAVPREVQMEVSRHLIAFHKQVSCRIGRLHHEVGVGLEPHPGR